MAAADEPGDGYTLAFAECCERSTLNHNTVRTCLSAPADAPEHLPHARVPAGQGRPAIRVRQADFDDWLARITTPALPPGAELIRPLEGVRIFAGEPLDRRSADYSRHSQRLAAEVRRGRQITYYRLGVARYARGPVEELAKLRAEEGYTPEATPHRRAKKAERARGKRDGLLNTQDAAERCNVTRKTAERWGQKGRFGAQKRAGQWFFDETQLPPARTRAAPTPLVTVTCAVCGGTFERRGSEVRRTRQRAKDDGRHPRFFCGGCWNTNEARALRARRNHSPETRARMSDGQRASWTPQRSAKQRASWTPQRRAKQRDHARQVLVPKQNSPAIVADRSDKMTRTKYGHRLTKARRAELETKTRQRNQAGTSQVAGRQQLDEWITRDWPKPEMTVPKMATEYGVSERYIRMRASALGLPNRTGGRPRKKP